MAAEYDVPVKPVSLTRESTKLVRIAAHDFQTTSYITTGPDGAKLVVTRKGTAVPSGSVDKLIADAARSGVKLEVGI